MKNFDLSVKAVLLLLFVLAAMEVDMKTVTYTSYQTVLNYTKTVTESPIPATVVVYNSTTAATETRTISLSTTSTPPPEVIFTTTSHLYEYTSITTTTTSTSKLISSQFSTYTVQ